MIKKAKYVAIIMLMVIAACLQFTLVNFDATIIVFQTVVALGFAVLLCQINPWIGIFYALSLFSQFYPVYNANSINTFECITYGMMALYVMYQVKDTEVLLDGICAIVLFNLLWMIVQRYHGDYSTGWSGNINHSSALMAVGAAAFLRRIRWVFIPLVLYGLYLARSTGGVISLSAAILVFMLIRGHKFTACLMLIVPVVYMIFVDRPGVGARAQIWIAGINIMQEQGLAGHGLGQWRVVFENVIFRQYPTLRAHRAHNEYLQILFECGPAMLLCIAGYFVNVCQKAKHAVLPFFAIIIMSVNSFYSFPFHIAPLCVVLLAWIVIFERRVCQQSRT